MAKVTIEGSRATPSVVLAPGVRKTVALTERVQRLIDRGFVTVVERFEDVPAPAAESAATPAPATPAVPEPDDDTGPEDNHPPFNADRAVWVAFLDDLTPPVPYAQGDTRDDLIKRWQQTLPEKT